MAPVPETEPEVLATEAWAAVGVVPAEDAAAVRERAPVVDAALVERIDERERVTDHDVAAFVDVVQEAIGPPAGKWVHYGLTSSDVVDTANALLLKESCEVLLAKVDAMLPVLQRRAYEFKDTPQMGRTHGIHAEPTSFGLVWALWYSEMLRNRERLERAKEAVSVGKISGAVGAFAHLAPDVEERVCERLGIMAAPVSTQVI